ncbi:MAG TPA: mechanosensitive ion channel, partial [Campylobacterales bacterium]|nr:mechanosensitive ion channel [Campylobacterales bacterium]
YADKVSDANVTKELNSSTVFDSNVSNDDISVIEEALKQRKIEAEKRLQEEKRQKAILREQKRMEGKRRLRAKIDALVQAKEEIDDALKKDNIWASRYLSYESYKELKKKLEKIDDEILVFQSQNTLNEVQSRELTKLQDESKIIAGKIAQLDDYKSEPFREYNKAINLEDAPVVTNPLDILTALSYQKHLKSLSEENERKYRSLLDALDKIEQKKALLEKLSILSDDKKYLKELARTKVKLQDFELAKAVFETKMETFAQQVSQININIDKGIEKEVKKSIVTGIIIFFLLLIFLLVKYLVRKYMSDNDLFYSINKVVNFIFIFMVFIILLLTYLENVENITTILSFASAGIAIALKDWFMSVLGWLVILVSGSIHVGDRVRFYKDGIEYVGDIVDISILRMTLHEDVTLTTVMVNKRSGRIVFIPNNYIFTDMIANYSHSGLKTVWDGIEFIITFDSNVAKAQAITKEVTRQYSKGYTDMTRKQLNRLRSKYSVRNTGVEPRIFTVIEPYGLRITGWYLTNSYATLTLRTTISVEVISRIQKEHDIQLALPSQSLYMNKPLSRAPLVDGEEPTESHKPIS